MSMSVKDFLLLPTFHSLFLINFKDRPVVPSCSQNDRKFLTLYVIGWGRMGEVSGRQGLRKGCGVGRGEVGRGYW